MIVGQKRIIHRFIRPISDYEEGGVYYNHIIPIDTQAYAHYPKEYGRDYNLWYVFGDGVHTYTEIRDGKGILDTAKEYPIFTQEYIESFVTFDKLYEILDEELIAENIKYQNKDYDYENVKESLDAILYKEPIVTLHGGNIYEKGTVIDTLNLTWEINKNVDSQILLPDIGEIDNNLRAYTIENLNITEDTTYTLIANDGLNSGIGETEILFRNYVYYGSSSSINLTNEEILNFSKFFETTTSNLLTFNCSGGKYLYVVIPIKYLNNISLKINGFIFNDVTKTEIDLINETGYTSKYIVLKSNNIQTYSSIKMEYCI